MVEYQRNEVKNMICVTIDELVPCLKDAVTGATVETEVIRIKRKSFLKQFNERNGWYVNWNSLADSNEIYALVLKGTVDIQGLIAIQDNPDYKAVYISWAVAAPSNNPELTDFKKYEGVGGHLLAIAIDKSEQFGYNGDVTGFCRSEQILQHFVQKHGAVALRMLHEYHIGIFDDAAKKIREVYDYEWTEEEI